MTKSWTIGWTASTESRFAQRQPQTLLDQIVAAYRAGAYSTVLQLSNKYGQEVASSPTMLNAVGLSAQALRDTRRAEDAYRQAITLAPDYPDPHNNLGIILRIQRSYAEAEAAYRTAISLRPVFPEAYNNLANLLLALKHFADAETAFRTALLQRPGYADARWGLSHLLLSLGRYTEGWQQYESRLDPTLTASMPAPLWQLPRWHGEPLHDRSILIWFEQGLGDCIQFYRYLPMLRERGIAKVTVACQPSLIPLIEKASGVDAVRAIGDRRLPGHHDFWAPLMSLPLAFGTTLASIPNCVPGFSAPSHYRQKWKHRISRDKFTVGLAWKGNPAHKDDANRSLPNLEVLSTLWTTPGVAFFSLQKGAGEDEAVAVAAECDSFQHLGGEIGDLADTAACIEELDLIISVDTVVAHLAGSLGKPCWVLLPYVDTDWRWLEERDDSPWYPSLRIFRQTSPHDWKSVFQNVLTSLTATVSGTARERDVKFEARH